MTDVAATRRHLTDLPSLYSLLPLFVLPGSGPDDERRGTGNPSRPPGRVDVFDLTDERTKPDADPVRGDYDLDRRAGARRQGILPTLASWSRLIDGELWDEGREHEPPADDTTVAGECGFLAKHLDWASSQQWFDELAADVHGMWRDVRHMVGERDVPLVCTVPGCGWQVVEMDGGSWFRCTGCGKSTSRIEAHRVVERSRPRPLRECALQAEVSERTLRYAIAEGDLSPAGRDGKVDLFTHDDVSAALAKRKIQQQMESA